MAADYETATAPDPENCDPVIVAELEAWRRDNFDCTEYSGDGVDDADPAGDDNTNFQEFIAGTDPNNPADVFAAATFSRSPGMCTMKVAGKKGRSYVLERLVLGSEEAISWSVRATASQLDTDSLVTLVDATSPGISGLFRVRVTIP